jgi:hypothetical protein
MAEIRTTVPSRMGVDIAYTLAAVDATLDPVIVHAAGVQIVEIFRELVPHPVHQGDVPGCVPLRLVRNALFHLPPPIFDAAIRQMEAADEPPVEITYMDHPTPADIAGAVVTVTDGDVYLCNQLGLIEA